MDTSSTACFRSSAARRCSFDKDLAIALSSVRIPVCGVVTYFDCSIKYHRTDRSHTHGRVNWSKGSSVFSKGPSQRIQSKASRVQHNDAERHASKSLAFCSRLRTVISCALCDHHGLFPAIPACLRLPQPIKLLAACGVKGGCAW